MELKALELHVACNERTNVFPCRKSRRQASAMGLRENIRIIIYIETDRLEEQTRGRNGELEHMFELF